MKKCCIQYISEEFVTSTQYGDQFYSCGVYMTEVPDSIQVGKVDSSKNSSYIYADHFTVS